MKYLPRAGSEGCWVNGSVVCSCGATVSRDNEFYGRFAKFRWICFCAFGVQVLQVMREFSCGLVSVRDYILLRPTTAARTQVLP